MTCSPTASAASSSDRQHRIHDEVRSCVRPFCKEALEFGRIGLGVCLDLHDLAVNLFDDLLLTLARKNLGLFFGFGHHV